MDRFVAGDCAPSCPEGAKMLACTHPAFDGPMILFQDVIKILHGAMLAVLLQNTLLFEPYNRRRVRGMLVGVDDSRRRMIRFAQRFGMPMNKTFADSESKAFADSERAKSEDSDSLKQLSAEWWQWALSIPTSVNPLADTTGEKSMVGQHGPIWFLAGSSTGGMVTRTCSV